MSRNNMPSMRPAAAVEPTPVHMLPVDVLVYIIDYAPLHGRLCAISLVCKRWRLAAMRSITSIRGRMPGLSHTHQVLPLLPCLTDFDHPFASFTEPTVLPPRLTKLSFFSLEKQCISSPYPALKSLAVSGTTSGGASLPLLLQTWSASLTSLSFGSYKMCKPLESFLSSSAVFPALVALGLDLHDAYGDTKNNTNIKHALLAFIKRHAKQLTSSERRLDKVMHG